MTEKILFKKIKYIVKIISELIYMCKYNEL